MYNSANPRSLMANWLLSIPSAILDLKWAIIDFRMLHNTIKQGESFFYVQKYSLRSR